MKILMISSYVTINSRPEFTKNKTGFGYMVYDIAKSIGCKEKVDVLCSDSQGGEFSIEGVHYFERSFRLLFKNIFLCVSLGVFLRMWFKYKMSFGASIRLFYYWLMSGYLVYILKKSEYSIVHIHQNVFDTEIWIAACHKCNQKFVVTLHGLNSFSETIKLEPAGKRYERDMLKRVTNGEFPITVISTGIKRIIERKYDSKGNNNIFVVCNAFLFTDTRYSDINVRDMYNIPDSAKIILYAGNISNNKNQKQLAESFDLMPESLCENTYVLFCGKDLGDGSQLEKAISNSKYKSHFIVCGGIDKEIMPNYFSNADGVVLLSYAEGFGLSLVEGLHFGVPCMTFKDLDAFEDIYDDNAVVAINNRSNASVAISLEELLTRKWDKAKIYESSKRFEAQRMADNYIKVYKTIIDR